MSIEMHRTVEHAHDSGNQSCLHIKTMEFEDRKVSILVADDYDYSAAIHSRSQLDRLIKNLRWVADKKAAELDPDWEKPDE